MRKIAAAAMTAMASTIGPADYSRAFNDPPRSRRYYSAYLEVPFKLINHFMAQNGDVMTRQVSRQLQRYRWKAHVTTRNRRGQRCPYERIAA